MRAYARLYLHDAQRALGRMVDSAVNGMSITSDKLSEMFVRSGCSRQFGMGNPFVVAGMTGDELLRYILTRCGEDSEGLDTVTHHDTTPEYWAGWALAYHQWCTARSFEYILSRIPLSEIIGMYHPYHEMDPMQFVHAMEERLRRSRGDSNLKRRRLFCNLSQSELAERSGVKLRMIQLYEQGRNNIGKAQYVTLARLATVLRCPVEAIVDDPLYAGEMDLDDGDRGRVR